MNNLSAVIIAAEDEQTALDMLDAEEASQAASLQLADALTAQEQYDATILRPHDGALARQIAGCDEWEWQQHGEWIEDPLDISDRPVEPVIPEVAHHEGSRGAAPHKAQQQQQQQQQQDVPSAGGFLLSESALENLQYLMSRPFLVEPDCQPDSSCPGDQAQHQHMRAGSSSSYLHGASSSSGYAGPSSSSGYHHGGASSSGLSSSGHHYSGCAGPSSSKASAKVQCGICFDTFAAHDMVAAYEPPEAACSSSSTGRCSHLYCTECMRGYVQDKVQSRKYPILCPDPGCHLELGVDDIQALLAEDPQILQVFEYLIAEHLIDTARRVYCPYKDCSVLLERPEPDEEMLDAAGNQEAPYECPCCKRQFCLSCGITGWHVGLTCKDFQALPAELRSAEDAAVHHIANSKSWKRCPSQGCGHMVERSEGCNHVRCLCGCSFCYACGTPYTDTQPTADNVHGTPGCACSLFAVPEEDGDAEQQQQQQQQAPVAVVLHQANRRPKPWRNGRFVSRTRCRHSESIYDCPNGPARCWFWHDEDDEEV